MNPICARISQRTETPAGFGSGAQSRTYPILLVHNLLALEDILSFVDTFWGPCAESLLAHALRVVQRFRDCLLETNIITRKIATIPKRLIPAPAPCPACGPTCSHTPDDVVYCKSRCTMVLGQDL